MFVKSWMIKWQGFSKAVAANPSKWKHIYDSSQPFKEAMPDDWGSRLTSFQKLLIIRTIRPDILVMCVNSFVHEIMGQRWTTNFWLVKSLLWLYSDNPLGFYPFSWIRSYGSTLKICWRLKTAGKVACIPNWCFPTLITYQFVQDI